MTTTTTTKPTILIVPGSFAPASLYDNFIPLLKKAGFPAFAMQLPSTVKRMPLPPATMQDDADAIRGVVEMLGNFGREVVVVCHSYGGTPTTQALAGVKGVKRLVYMTAIVPRKGESNTSAVGMTEDMLPPATEGYMHVDATGMAAGVLNDMAYEDAYPLVLKLAHHSAVSFSGTVSEAAYETHPVSYILTEQDLIVKPELQKKFIALLEENGRKVDVRTLNSGHMPTASAPEKLLEIITQIAEMA